MPFTPDLNAVNSAKSTIDIGYNNVDIELGRSFFLSKDFSVKPYLALKAAWIDLKQKTRYIKESDYSILAIFFQYDSPDFKADTKSNFCGLGPRIGFENKYYFNTEFNFFGDFSASILYGFFRTSQHDSIPNLGFGELLTQEQIEQIEQLLNFTTSAPSRDLKHKFHQYIPYANMWLGLEWNKYLFEKKYHLRLKAGYEVQYYWRVNQMEDAGGNVNSIAIESVTFDPISITAKTAGHYKNNHGSEDLMFYGITAEARLDF